MAALAQTNTHPCAISTYLETTMTTFSLLLLHYGATEVLPSRAESFLLLSTCVCVCLCVCVRARAHACVRTQSCPILCNLMDCSPPSSLYMEFSSQEYRSRYPFPTPEDLPNPGMKPMSLVSLALFFSAGGFFTISTTWEASLKST